MSDCSCAPAPLLSSAPIPPVERAIPVATLGDDCLRQVAQTGLTRVGVPASLGGAGGSRVDLVDGMIDLARRALPAGLVLWSQRLAVETLLASPNAALREHGLHDLLHGHRAGACPLFPADRASSPEAPIVARSGGRALRLDGHLPAVVNLQWAGYWVFAPVSLGPDAPRALAMLRCEEDGLHAAPDLATPGLHGSRTAALAVERVFFREDELLASDASEVMTATAPTDLALRCGLLIGALLARLDEVDAAQAPILSRAVEAEARELRLGLCAETPSLADVGSTLGRLAALTGLAARAFPAPHPLETLAGLLGPAPP